MPYLTPQELPEERDCRALSIPANSDWLAIVSGALTELEKEWNWEQHGAVTISEAVDAMRSMITAYYDGCTACTLPGGYRATRINASGHMEVLDDSGNWVDATGDYAYPPLTPREGGTEQDQICLAATNAVNVLSLAYEQITEAYASELSAAEALTTLIEWFIITVGGEAAPFAFAIALFLIPVFILAYEALDYLTADLWDDNFTQQFICMLVSCATNTDGVVTFDWDCVEHALYANTYSEGFNELQLRLYLQINFILWVLGGVDALDAAANTTAIETADCSACAGVWQYTWDFAADGKGIWDVWNSEATWTAGVGFQSKNNTGGWQTVAAIKPTLTVPDGVEITDMWISTNVAGGYPGTIYFYYNLTGGQYYTLTDMVCPYEAVSNLGGTGAKDWLLQLVLSSIGSFTITGVTLEGTGSNPFGSNSFNPNELCA